MKLTDPKLSLKFEDAFSLAPVYLPISVRGTDPKNTYSGPFILEMTRYVWWSAHRVIAVIQSVVITEHY